MAAAMTASRGSRRPSQSSQIWPANAQGNVGGDIDFDSTGAEIKKQPKRQRKKFTSASESVYVERFDLTDWALGTILGQACSLLVFGMIQVFLGMFVWKMAGGGGDYSTKWEDSLWASWVMFVDPGTLTGLGVNTTAGIRIAAVFLSIAGFTYFCTVLGFVVDHIRVYMDILKQVYSKIVLNDHVVILGFGVKTLFLVKELALDNFNSGRTLQLVILDSADRFEMSRTLHLFLAKYEGLSKSIRVTTWSGDCQESDDLLRISVCAAKTVFVLGEGEAQAADQSVLRTILAIQGLPYQCKGKIVAEVAVPENLAILQAIGGDRIIGILARDMINNVVALNAVLPKIGTLWTDLMQFAGNEIYSFHDPQHIGCRFGDLEATAANAIFIGIYEANGCVRICPSDDYVIQPSDEVLAISDDDHLDKVDPPSVGNLDNYVSPTLLNLSDEEYAYKRNVNSHGDKVICLVGWPSDLPDMVMHMSKLVGSGSELFVLSPMTFKNRRRRLLDANLLEAQSTAVPIDDNVTAITHEMLRIPTSKLPNLRVHHVVGSPVVPHQLGGEESQMPMKDADAILILADDEAEEAIESDSVVLTAMMHLTQGGLMGDSTIKPVCEVSDWRSERIVRKNELLKTSATFVKTAELETGLFALCAHNPLTAKIIRHLVQLEPDTSGFCEMSATVFVFVGSSLTFNEMSAIVKRKSEILVGYSLSIGPDIVLNPQDKNKKITWTESDVLLILQPGTERDTGFACTSKYPSAHSSAAPSRCASTEPGAPGPDSASAVTVGPVDSP